jgi:hypothetical protein
MTDNAIKQFDQEIIVAQLLKLMKLQIEQPALSRREACEELGLSYHAVLQWMRDGHLAQYLQESRDAYSDYAQMLALKELPAIVSFQAQIALGQQSPRGSNPTAAAQFVADMATRGAHDAPPKVVGNQVNLFMPKMPENVESVIDAPHVREVKP